MIGIYQSICIVLEQFGRRASFPLDLRLCEGLFAPIQSATTDLLVERGSYLQVRIGDVESKRLACQDTQHHYPDNCNDGD